MKKKLIKRKVLKQFDIYLREQENKPLEELIYEEIITYSKHIDAVMLIQVDYGVYYAPLIKDSYDFNLADV